MSLQEFKPMFLSNMSRMEFYSLPDVYFYEVTCEFSYVEVTETDTSFQSLTYPVGIIFNGSKEPDLIMSISLNIHSLLAITYPTSKSFWVELSV